MIHDNYICDCGNYGEYETTCSQCHATRGHVVARHDELEGAEGQCQKKSPKGWNCCLRYDHIFHHTARTTPSVVVDRWLNDGTPCRRDRARATVTTFIVVEADTADGVITATSSQHDWHFTSEPTRLCGAECEKRWAERRAEWTEERNRLTLRLRDAEAAARQMEEALVEQRESYESTIHAHSDELAALLRVLRATKATNR